MSIAAASSDIGGVLKIIEIVRSLLPHGTDGTSLRVVKGKKIPTSNNVDRCPIWPPDVFAVVGTLIERSSCYTEADPDLDNIQERIQYLGVVSSVVAGSEEGLFRTPAAVDELWNTIVHVYGDLELYKVLQERPLVESLLRLFAIADEACRGMGWDSYVSENIFAAFALASFIQKPRRKNKVVLPYRPNSLCALVPPHVAIVMPKTLTATVGCTIRSLSHHLALLPGSLQCRPSWALTNEIDPGDSYRPIRLIVIPFPFSLSSDSFSLAAEPKQLAEGNSTAAFFGLEQSWLRNRDGTEISANQLFEGLIQPLIAQANLSDNRPVTGIVLPECALSEALANQLARRVRRTGISFMTTGIVSKQPRTGRMRNVAKTYVFNGRHEPYWELEQFKHHRWRLDRRQCQQYGLDFCSSSKAEKWWEDIDVSQRMLPFFALRKDMSMTVLICEDLARNDPAMSVVRAIGPNLVIALLMDGPQLGGRWPGKYATVLGEDPGAGVLSVTCAAMVDRSNEAWSGVKRRVVALWRGEEDGMREIELPVGAHAMVLNINHRAVLQHTLDNRSDEYGSRKLSLGRTTALKLNTVPAWL